MKTQINKATILSVFIFLIPAISFGQENARISTESYFSNPLFNTLLILIIVLLLAIIALGQALKNISGSDYLISKLEKNKIEKSAGKTGIIKSVSFAFLLLSSISGNAETISGSSDKWQIGGLDQFTFYFMLTVILLESMIILILYRLIIDFVKNDNPVLIAEKVKSKTFLEKINASVDIEEEQNITLEHEYDGIRELDNDLPPWWKYGFYLTIAIGVVYLIHYHVTGTGDLQIKEYEKSLAKAKIEIEEYMKTAANNVDETNVKMLGAEDIASGKELFIASCAACHGKAGQGGVGPNLTDSYWLHSGSLADIFKSIKYGWVDKGMKSWKDDFSPVQIAQLTSFIMSINGTNPANGKAPEGDLYKAQDILGDSIATVLDSLTVKIDSLTGK